MFGVQRFASARPLRINLKMSGRGRVRFNLRAESSEEEKKKRQKDFFLSSVYFFGSVVAFRLGKDRIFMFQMYHNVGSFSVLIIFGYVAILVYPVFLFCLFPPYRQLGISVCCCVLLTVSHPSFLFEFFVRNVNEECECLR